MLQRAGNAGTILFFRELAELTHEQSYRENRLDWGRLHCRPSRENYDLRSLSRIGRDSIRARSGEATKRGLFPARRARLGDRSAWSQHERGSSRRAVERFERSLFRDRRHWVGVGSSRQGNRQKGLTGIGEGAGERLLALARKSVYGDYWTSSTTHSTHYPNFSHGTAGIGYFLAELYEATHDERYRTCALAAGRYLRALASKAETSNCLIFHNDAAGQELPPICRAGRGLSHCESRKGCEQNEMDPGG